MKSPSTTARSLVDRTFEGGATVTGRHIIDTSARAADEINSYPKRKFRPFIKRKVSAEQAQRVANNIAPGNEYKRLSRKDFEESQLDQDAYEKGSQARYDDADVSTNPYKAYSHEWSSWQEGYDAADIDMCNVEDDKVSESGREIRNLSTNHKLEADFQRDHACDAWPIKRELNWPKERRDAAPDFGDEEDELSVPPRERDEREARARRMDPRAHHEGIGEQPRLAHRGWDSDGQNPPHTRRIGPHDELPGNTPVYCNGKPGVVMKCQSVPASNMRGDPDDSNNRVMVHTCRLDNGKIWRGNYSFLTLRDAKPGERPFLASGDTEVYPSHYGLTSSEKVDQTKIEQDDREMDDPARIADELGVQGKDENGPVTEIEQILMDRDGVSREDAAEQLRDARSRVADGENPEEILHDDFGLESDYIFDLMP